MTKYMAAFVVAIMLLGQVAVAQHNAVHFTDHGFYEYGHDDHDDDDHQKSANEACQICSLAKSLSLGIVAYHVDFNPYVLSGADTYIAYGPIVINHQYTRYNPRAPPFFLI